VSAELFDLLEACADYHRRSRGAFDITVGPLMKVWKFYKGEGALPKPAEVTGALALVSMRHVRLDRAARTVRFDRPGVELDPGGIGKGYAVDRMVEVLKRTIFVLFANRPANAASGPEFSVPASGCAATNWLRRGWFSIALQIIDLVDPVSMTTAWGDM
jgi:hypothetical protein